MSETFDNRKCPIPLMFLQSDKGDFAQSINLDECTKKILKRYTIEFHLAGDPENEFQLVALLK